jgi:SAM-dependent methyltransferase
VGGYAFGDSSAAARRLGLLAELFEPASRVFLGRFAGRRFDLAVDLGCGPGHTTHLLAAVLEPRRTLGLDQSAAFIRLAAAGRPAGSQAAAGPPLGSLAGAGPAGRVEFAVHDVTRVPFPCPPADLVSCRLLLSHLADPAAALAAWATQLAPGGLLLVEEVERIHTGDPALAGYLATAGALLASRGQTLEVGPALHRLPDPPRLARRHDQVATLAPPAARAAEMFAQNLAVWGRQAVADGVSGEAELRDLAEDLVTVAGGGRAAAITWELRQLAFEHA